MYPDAADAHAWAASVRELRTAIAAAMSDGRISTRVAAPEHVYDILVALLTEVDALPCTGPLDPLPTMAEPGFHAWAHYHRGVRAWASALIADGLLNVRTSREALAFERWLFAAASAEQTTESNVP